MKIKSIFQFLIVISMLSTIGTTEIVPGPGSQDLVKQYAKAALVLSGRVDSITDRPPRFSVAVNGHQVGVVTHEASISIDRVYKGENLDRYILVVYETNLPMGTFSQPAFRRGEYALIFLNPGTANSFVFADKFMVIFDTVPTGSGNQGRSGLEQIASDTAAALSHSEGESLNALLDILIGLKTSDQVVVNSVQPFTANTDSRIAIKAFSILLKTGRPEYFEAFADYFFAHGAISTDAIWAVSPTLAKPLDRRSVGALARLSKSGNIAIRLNSMEGLRYLRDPVSIPVLVDHLNDSDNDSRFTALITLNEILKFGDDYGPSYVDFLKDPARYLEIWKTWWRQEGKVQYAIPASPN